jgi:hypothetical protein
MSMFAVSVHGGHASHNTNVEPYGLPHCCLILLIPLLLNQWWQEYERF